MSKFKIAIFASGSGSNAENIYNYFSKRDDVEICIIISNKSDAYVHDRAARLGLKSITLSKAEIENEQVLLGVLRESQADLIVLAGFLLMIPSFLVKAYEDRIVNIHPALLPKFGGKGMYGDRVHKAVIEAGEKESGITIHLIDEKYDEGKTVFQAKCAVNEGDTPDDVASKVHALEYEYFPKVIDTLVEKIKSGGKK
jgi:phosphoribosylglycinamide formyltransferase-1